MKKFLKKYQHAWVLLYFPIYMIWFFYLEKTSKLKYTSIHIKLDNYIPFNEWFILPYYFWFLFIVLVVGYLFFTNRTQFYKNVAFLFIGMTICLTIYTIWPNGQDLRPDLDTLGRDNIALQIVRFLYKTDSYTNVCPSIHVFNTIGVCIGIFHNEKLRSKKWITIPSLIISVFICLATVFLKQHSAFDIICAFVLAIFMYIIAYVIDYSKLIAKVKAYKAAKATNVD